MESESKSPKDLTPDEAASTGKRFGMLVVASLKQAGFYEECSRLMDIMKESPACDSFLKSILDTMGRGLKRGPLGMGIRMQMAHALRNASNELESAALALAVDKHESGSADGSDVSQLDSLVAHASNGHKAANIMSEDINDGVRGVLGKVISQHAMGQMKEMIAGATQDCGNPDCELHGKKEEEKGAGIPKIILN